MSGREFHQVGGRPHALAVLPVAEYCSLFWREGILAGRRADVLEIREVIRRLQLGETDRRIARDLQVSRKTVSKYRTWAHGQALLTGALPDPEALQASLSTTVPVAIPPAIPSKVTPLWGPGDRAAPRWNGATTLGASRETA